MDTDLLSQERVKEFVGKRKSVGCRFRDLYDIKWAFIDDIEVSYKIPFPFMGCIVQEMKEGIYF